MKPTGTSLCRSKYGPVKQNLYFAFLYHFPPPPPLFFSYDFTPMDSSAVYVLSSMARQRRASLSCGVTGSRDFERSEGSTYCGPTQASPISSPSLYGKAGKSYSSGTTSTVTATSPNKCKRPMNAFMLFAKKYRVEYTQMYPGKDNR